MLGVTVTNKGLELVYPSRSSTGVQATIWAELDFFNVLQLLTTREDISL